MKLTKEEEKVIREMRKKAEAEKPYREAFLKHDLYIHNDLNCDSDFELGNPFKGEYGFSQVTKGQMEQLILIFTNGFEKVLNKGDRFVSYIEDGTELWYDDVGYGIEGVDNNWSKIYLENFQKLR